MDGTHDERPVRSAEAGSSGRSDVGSPPPVRSTRADEILDVAMRLFADRGYAATPVADIQEAAGMTPGSGALYKHFPSKQALLEAGVERFVAEGATAATALPAVDEQQLEDVLRLIGSRALDALDRDRSTMRVAWRDLPAFPDLSRRFVDARLQFGFARLADWLTELEESGRVDAEDPQATAAVLLGGLAFYRVMETMLGERPARVDDRRFLDAWVRVAVRALRPPDADHDSGPQP